MSVTDHTAQLVPFHYREHTVRTVLIDGEPWFVLADLCKVLGIRNVKDVRDRLSDGVDQTYPIADSLGRVQNATVVNESGMYEVVIRSDRPEAVTFRRWITGTVLPEIRRTGSYNAAPALTPAEEMARGLVAAQQLLEQKSQQIAELTPPARAWTNLAAANGDYSVGDAAKVLNRDAEITTGRDRLFAFMVEQKWIYRSANHRGGYEAYQSQVDAGRLTQRPARPFLNERTGEYELPAPTIRIAAKGLQKLHELLGGGRQLTVVDGGVA